jgi:hypothetical protein
MWWRLIPLVLVPLPLPAAAWSPLRDVVCFARPALVERLRVQQGATLRATGLRDAETVIEVWATQGGRWSMVQTYANGTACIIAMGADWQAEGPPA